MLTWEPTENKAAARRWMLMCYAGPVERMLSSILSTSALITWSKKRERRLQKERLLLDDVEALSERRGLYGPGLEAAVRKARELMDELDWDCDPLVAAALGVSMTVTELRRHKRGQESRTLTWPAKEDQM